MPLKPGDLALRAISEAGSHTMGGASLGAFLLMTDPQAEEILDEHQYRQFIRIGFGEGTPPDFSKRVKLCAIQALRLVLGLWKLKLNVTEH